MHARPDSELATFLITQSPVFSSTYPCKSRHAVRGLIFNIAAWTGSTCDGTTTSCSTLTAQASRQLPRLCGKITSEPIVSLLTFSPSSDTIPEPSKPGTAGTSRFPGYFPSIAFKSAGLIGAACISTTTSLAPGLGHG